MPGPSSTHSSLRDTRQSLTPKPLGKHIAPPIPRQGGGKQCVGASNRIQLAFSFDPAISDVLLAGRDCNNRELESVNRPAMHISVSTNVVSNM